MKLDSDCQFPMRKQTGNISQNIVQQDIDDGTKMVIEYFESHNIPYHMINRIAIRDEDISTPKAVSMTCKRCKKVHDMPYDIYMEMLEYQDLYDDSDVLEIECIYCNRGIMIPKTHLKKELFLTIHSHIFITELIF